MASMAKGRRKGERASSFLVSARSPGQRGGERGIRFPIRNDDFTRILFPSSCLQVRDRWTDQAGIQASPEKSEPSIDAIPSIRFDAFPRDIFVAGPTHMSSRSCQLANDYIYRTLPSFPSFVGSARCRRSPKFHATACSVAVRLMAKRISRLCVRPNIRVFSA